MAALNIAPNLARHWQIMSIAPCTEDEVAGTYTVGTYIPFLASIIDYTEEGIREMENVSPATRNQRNPVQLEVGTRVTLQEYMQNTLAALPGYQSTLRKLDVLNSLVAVKAQFVTGGETGVLIARITGSNFRRPKAPAIAQLTVESVDIGAANPSYT